MLRRHGSLAGWIVCLVVVLGGCGDDDGPERDGGGGDEDGGREDGGRVDGGRPDGGDTDAGPAVCGDGVQGDGEACDDGNTDDDDGCAGDCASVDDGFVCVRPGEDCVRVATCGNGRIEGPETCDDRNASAGDGCDARCMLEPGWTCPVVGAACRAAACGDGLVAGFEACDDGGTCNGGDRTRCTSSADCVAVDDGDACEARAGDGCDTSCQLEPGAVCPTPGEPCGRSTCGDGIPEGTEECDDGNPLIGDGCTPLCTREPDCTDGTCVAVCGDGVVFAPETCDDANTRSGDGCSATCQEEVGFVCEEVPLPDPPTVVLPVVMRDFIPACQDGNSAVTTRLREGQPGATPPFGHPDFQCFNGAERGMVETMLVDGRPVRRATATRISSAESFDLWYRSDDDYNRTVAQSMTFSSIGAGTYRFDASSFFPLSTPLSGPVAGFPTEGLEGLTNDGGGSGAQNFFFTSEVRFWFEYGGTETLAFSGDDDVWVFINERLAVDIGGVHGREDGSITLADCASGDPAENAPSCLAPLGLRIGGIYEAVVFQAERHTTRSQYRLTLANFVRAPSLCRSECGDGVLAADEACDEGDDNGAEYDGCSEDCRLTPYCGDGIVQEAFGETCDDGRNLGARPEDCAPGCQSIGARCGDGVVQTEAGEECDDGNTTSLDGCSAECRIELI